jgi:acyl-CoA synthetase (AMP-forming)/AMP-acid ligase II
VSAALNLVELMEEQAVRYDRTPLYRYLDTGLEWTFADLAVRAARVAGQLASGGVEPGARVGILAADRAAFSDAFFGLQHLGAIPVPLGIAGKVGSEAWTALLADRVARFGLVAVATEPAVAPELAAVVAPARAIGVDGERGNPVPPGPASAIALVQPSSGTTGDPKGIVVSQRALLANLAATEEQWELDASDSGLSWLPLFHDMGLIGTVINALHLGGTLHHWPTESFLRSPSRWLSLVGELRITVAIAPPFALELVTRRMRRRGGDVDLSALRHLLVGAEQIRPEVLEAFTEVAGPCGLAPEALCPTYGLAEATLAVSATPAKVPYRVVEDERHRFTSCGPPVPGVEVALDDAGELLVRSPGVMDGYLDDPEATAAALAGGWLHTGDAARIVDGEVVIVGRRKEMVNRGGQRLPASDFELAVHGVDGVLPDRVVAFGDRGPDGERVVLLAESRRRGAHAGEIVLALRARLADAGLAADVVELVRPGFIPRTTSGKLRRGAAHDAWLASPSQRLP